MLTHSFQICHGFPCVKRRTSAKSPPRVFEENPPPPLRVDRFSKKSALGGTMPPEIRKNKWKILPPPNCHIFLVLILIILGIQVSIVSKRDTCCVDILFVQQLQLLSTPGEIWCFLAWHWHSVLPKKTGFWGWSKVYDSWLFSCKCINHIMILYYIILFYIILILCYIILILYYILL